MASLAPITDMMVADLAQEEASQIYTLCGRGGRSSLRVLKHGLQVTEEASSDLPGVPNGVWTIRGRQEESVDRYIVVSFTNATLVFGVGDSIEEVTDSGFLGTAPTLQVGVDGNISSSDSSSDSSSSSSSNNSSGCRSIKRVANYSLIRLPSVWIRLHSSQIIPCFR